MRIISSLILTSFIVVIIIACSSPEFEKSDGAITVSLDEAAWVLIPNEEEYVIDGVVRSFYRKSSGPYAVFCGTMTLQYELSDEEFYEAYGDPSPLMNELDDVIDGPCGQNFETLLRLRDETIVPISENKEIFGALKSVKPGDKVYLEGETAEVDSVDCKGETVKELSNIVLVNYAEINGKAYGD